MPSQQTQPIQPDLVERLRDGMVIPFAGAGVSLAARTAGTNGPVFPTWKQLLENAAAELKDRGATDPANAVSGLVGMGEYLQAAKFAREGFRKANRWAAFLRSQFHRKRGEIDDASLELTRLLWRLGSSVVITTNYDRLLEWTCPNDDDVVCWDIENVAELEAVFKGEFDDPVVWHLHGRITNADDLILTPDGYSKLYADSKSEKKYEAAPEAFRHALLRYSLLFVGFSFADKALCNQLRWLADTFSGYGPDHYALIREEEWSSSEERLRDLGITPIVFGDYGAPLLDRLRQMAEIAAGGQGVIFDPPPDPVKEKVDRFFQAADFDRAACDELIRLGPEASPLLIAAVDEDFTGTYLEPLMTSLRTPRQKRGIYVLSKMAEQGAMDYLQRLTPPGMCFVAAGRFKMGSGDYGNERPEHELDVDSFWLAEYPVSYLEFGPFVGDGAYRQRRFWTQAGWEWIQRKNRSQPWRWHEYERHKDHPVQWLSWYEAVAFVRRLAERKAAPYRLPTEAEWEKAAGWDPTANRKRRYPWGDEYDPQMHPSRWTAPNSGQEFRKAGSPYGLAHMCGHVWQWTSSLRWSFPYDAEDGREDLETPGERVFRGSSWANGAQREFFRCTSRYDPDREVRPEMNIEDDYEGPCGLRVAIGITEQELVSRKE